MEESWANFTRTKKDDVGQRLGTTWDEATWAAGVQLSQGCRQQKYLFLCSRSLYTYLGSCGQGCGWGGLKG